jgi:hypothetical protein
LQSFCAVTAGAGAAAGGGVTIAVVTGAGALTRAGADTAAKVVAVSGATSVDGCGLEDIMNAVTVATVKTRPSPPIIFAAVPPPGLRVCVCDTDLAAAGADACSMMVLPKPCT